MIKRDFYLEQIKKSMWGGEIKVITGLRRSGKSVLLFELFKDYLIESGINEENIITLSLDQRKHYKYRNPITLCNYVENIVSNSGDKYYLFIDEVQLSKTVKEEGIDVTVYDMLNELQTYKNLDIYVTGSNSKVLSSDIMTEFRGRSTQIHIYILYHLMNFIHVLVAMKKERLKNICCMEACQKYYHLMMKQIKRNI